MLMTLYWWEDEMAWERAGHFLSCAEAKRMKSLTLDANGFLMELFFSSVACNELLPAETDSVRSGGTSSIASDHQCRPDSSGNTTTSSSSQLSQLDDAESARHFATIHRSPTYRTNFIDLGELRTQPDFVIGLVSKKLN